MLELSPTLAYPTFEKIAFDSSLEQFLRYGHKNPAMVFAIVGKISVAECADIAIFAMGKKPVNASLAAQSFLLRKSIRGIPVHVSSLKGRAQAL